MGEGRFVASADYVISRTGRKVHKMKKIADTDYVEPKEDEDDEDEKKNVKESINDAITDEALDEAVLDKQDARFLQLGRLGLVDKADLGQLRVALQQLKADKQLTLSQRTLILSVTEELISLVTGDDTVFNRVRMDVQREATEETPPFDPPYKTVPAKVKDKSGATHDEMSRARHLARIAIQAQKKKPK